MNEPKLIALEGGPKRGQWFHRHDIEAQQETARYMQRRVPHTPSAALTILDYHPTTRAITRHIGKRGRGANTVEQIATATVWEYRPGDHHA